MAAKREKELCHRLAEPYEVVQGQISRLENTRRMCEILLVQGKAGWRVWISLDIFKKTMQNKPIKTLQEA